MTPPLALALSTIIFRNKYTAEEREAGKAAWILGASNITEGAIPFAVGDPLRVIPCIMAGSAVSSTLSLMFDCACRVPHAACGPRSSPTSLTTRFSGCSPSPAAPWSARSCSAS